MHTRLVAQLAQMNPCAAAAAASLLPPLRPFTPLHLPLVHLLAVLK